MLKGISSRRLGEQTKDSGETAECGMLNGNRNLASVFYVAGHYGSKSFNSRDFLAAIAPRYVVISSGEENRYGHLHEEVLQRVADLRAAVLRTDELGTIELISDGKVLWWEAKDE